MQGRTRHEVGWKEGHRAEHRDGKQRKGHRKGQIGTGQVQWSERLFLCQVTHKVSYVSSYSKYLGLPWWSVVKTLPSSAGDTGSILGQGAKIPWALRTKRQNTKQRQYCNKFSEGFKNGPHNTHTHTHTHTHTNLWKRNYYTHFLFEETETQISQITQNLQIQNDFPTEILIFWLEVIKRLGLDQVLTLFLWAFYLAHWVPVSSTIYWWFSH